MMRPPSLQPFFASIRSLDGIGPKTTILLGKLLRSGTDEPRLVDLIHLRPVSTIDRRARPGIAHAKPGEIVTLDLHIVQHRTPPSNKRHLPYLVHGCDETGSITLVFFHAQIAWLEQQLPVGCDVVVSGKVEWFHGKAQMIHPDHIALRGAAQHFPLVEPVYPLTAGLSPKTLVRACFQALERLPPLPEWLDEALIQREKFPSYAQALCQLHQPDRPEIIAPTSVVRRRLAMDEFLAGQLALALVRQKIRKSDGLSRPANGILLQKLWQNLPFELTQAQIKAFGEISADLAQNKRMLRLLQGDVGSGKTICALMASAQVADNGEQVALMAPTEVLARQHHASIAPLAAKIGLETALLTAREKGRIRADIFARLAKGEIQLLIGTHALFQSQVEYQHLGLAIVDEQHRFGVVQRLDLAKKGTATDLLMMTATPIPRSLVLSAFGDMDVSQIHQKPEGRKPITTATLSLGRLGELINRARAALDRGDKIYWICPLVEESESLDLTSAELRFKALYQIFGNKVGLVHGRMESTQKDVAMADFSSGKVQLLVATTVVEVGVDVRDASIIIIEHAERFGLAQLHQLRGRVGRGNKPSSCILLYKPPLSETARARLRIMRETQDGFRIAEEDLRLRGEGEILGMRQSGLANFQLAEIEHHIDLLEMARQDARLILERDPHLTSPRGEALRHLLYLFRQDEAIKLLRAG